MNPTESQSRWLAKKICDEFPEFNTNPDIGYSYGQGFEKIRGYLKTLDIDEYRRLVALSYNDKEVLKSIIATV